MLYRLKYVLSCTAALGFIGFGMLLHDVELIPPENEVTSYATAGVKPNTASKTSNLSGLAADGPLAIAPSDFKDCMGAASSSPFGTPLADDSASSLSRTVESVCSDAAAPSTDLFGGLNYKTLGKSELNSTLNNLRSGDIKAIRDYVQHTIKCKQLRQETQADLANDPSAENNQGIAELRECDFRDLEANDATFLSQAQAAAESGNTEASIALAQWSIAKIGLMLTAHFHPNKQSANSNTGSEAPNSPEDNNGTTEEEVRLEAFLEDPEFKRTIETAKQHLKAASEAVPEAKELLYAISEGSFE